MTSRLKSRSFQHERSTKISHHVGTSRCTDFSGNRKVCCVHGAVESILCKHSVSYLLFDMEWCSSAPASSVCSFVACRRIGLFFFSLASYRADCCICHIQQCRMHGSRDQDGCGPRRSNQLSMMHSTGLVNLNDFEMLEPRSNPQDRSTKSSTSSATHLATESSMNCEGGSTSQ